jgi:DNA-binding MarR family transcriptional regulator
VADVNQEIGPPVHMAHLLNRANRRLRHDAGRPASLPDLNPAQARILDVIPTGGCRIVDLSGELRVSKQGLGQLVNQLAAGGYVAVSDDPGDRRAKIVQRTPAGDDVVRGVRDLLAAVEDRWRDDIGAGRYAVFRSVLEELVGRPPTRAGE